MAAGKIDGLVLQISSASITFTKEKTCQLTVEKLSSH